jgi:hypothetical protein
MPKLKVSDSYEELRNQRLAVALRDEEERKHRAERERLAQEERRKLLLPPETDLRSICRDSDRCSTTVKIRMDWDVKGLWLRLGQTNITRRGGDNNPGCWQLEAYFKDGVTDFEHDSVKAISIPLIGLELDGLGIHYHKTWLNAWIDPNNADDFRVPGSGYDPTKLKDAHVCKDKSCRRADPKGHIIVPEGFYLPPRNLELYDKVRGKRVEILVGPKFETES